MSGVPLRGLGVCGTWSNWLIKSLRLSAKCLANASWSTVSSDKHQCVALIIGPWNRLALPTQTKTSGGSRETEHTAVAVIACLVPCCSAVAIVTPEVK